MNAAAYVYYAQEAGMTRTNYLKATGKAVSSKNGPKDTGMSSCNCRYFIKKIGKGCCKKAGFYRGWGHTKMSGKSLTELCQATCPDVDGAKKCGGNRPEDPARLADQATVDAAARAAAKRRISNDIRRCKLDKGTNCEQKAKANDAKKEKGKAAQKAK